MLERLKAQRGVPDELRVDNGPEFLSQALADWCQNNGVQIQYIQPGKPNQNAIHRTLQPDLSQRGVEPVSVPQPA